MFKRSHFRPKTLTKLKSLLIIGRVLPVSTATLHNDAGGHMDDLSCGNSTHFPSLCSSLHPKTLRPSAAFAPLQSTLPLPHSPATFPRCPARSAARIAPKTRPRTSSSTPSSTTSPPPAPSPTTTRKKPSSNFSPATTSSSTPPPARGNRGSRSPSSSNPSARAAAHLSDHC